MKNDLDQKTILNKNYLYPLDFILDYYVLYKEQTKTPFKVFLEDISYFKTYEQSFLNYLINLSNNNKIDINEYIKIEKILLNIKAQEFYDKQFYNITLLNFIKGIAILVDRVDLEICNYKFDNLKCLFMYTDAKIDLYKLFCEKLNTKKVSETKYWENFKKINDYMNIVNFEIKNTKISEYVNENELIKRVSISKKLLGEEKISNYEISGFLKVILTHFQNLELVNNEKYILITEFCSNYIIGGYGQENDLKDFVSYSKTLIN